MTTFKNKKILLGITGSIAAYKSAEVVRLLRAAGADVRVVMSEGATAFITPLTLQALCGHRVHEALLNAETEAAMSHIELARWADLILIAPATAQLLAKLATGFADDLLTTVCLATAAPIAIAPAMNTYMWLNAATQANIATLITRNIRILGPAKGSQACGEIGPGRMFEPQQIIDDINTIFNQSQLLKGKHILLTAGPTHENIDPVRYLSNYSSGKMGYALAAAAAIAGAKVTLVSGPTALQTPAHVTKIEVTTAQEMFDAVMKHIKDCDIFIAAAAVADYRVKKVQPQKIKKAATNLSLDLIRNPDILAAVAQLKSRPFIVGFAAETENVVNNAKKKLRDKNLDMVIANKVGPGMGFQSDVNEPYIITAKQTQHLPTALKTTLANDLIAIISKLQ